MDTLDKLKMFFGFGILFALATLAVCFAIGMVEEKTSYGLMPIVMALGGMGMQFSTWAFGNRQRSDFKDSRYRSKGTYVPTEASQKKDE